MRNSGRTWLIIGAGLLVTLIVSRMIVGLYTDSLWFRQLGYSSVFWTRLATDVIVRAIAAVIGGVIVLVNLWIVTRQLGPVQVRRRYGNLEISEQIPRKLVNTGIILAAILGGWWLSGVRFGGTASLTLLTWLRKTPWGAADPLFGNDISFYVFTLPVLFQIVEFFLLVVVWSLVLSMLGYALVGAVRVRANRFEIEPSARLHALVLVAALLVVIGIRFWIGRYGILMNGSGFTGALGYTDVHARLPAQRFIALLSVLCGGALIYSAVRRVWAPTAIAFGALLVAAIGGGVLYPSLIQKFRVTPNEFRFEEPYIKWNIDFTRRAYGLTDVVRKPYAYERLAGEPAELAARLDEIPVWDIEPLQTAYNQLQTFFRYYHFANIDYDRYYDDGVPRQVAIGVREFLATGLSENARTWLNLHFDPKYIRGVGATVTPTAVVTTGEPPTWLKDVNPIQRAADAPAELDLSDPSIYFGETMDNYVVIRPRADLKAPATAVPLSSFLRVVAFSWRFSDKNLLFMGGLTNGSSIVYRRRIGERVRMLAPFIAWDSDPYPVINNGRVVWIIDGYSVTSRFPLSRRVDAETMGGLRYMRNTVKATVDAATGETRIYRFDEKDPVLATYASAFPQLFAARSAMPAALQAHIRYPSFYLHEQAEVYGHYHLTNPDAFYRAEDVWTLPRASDAGTGGLPFRALYQMMTLPGESKDEFVLVAPYIAQQRQNMTAVLVARNDGANYGEVVMFELPRNQLIPGPAQVHAIVEQDPSISQRLSLWRQAGSDVNIGHARIVPLANSFLYVMPLYLSAQGSPIPELRRIIVSDGLRTAMEETLRGAVSAMFGSAPPAAPADTTRRPAAAATIPTPQAGWPREALELLDQAERALRSGDYATFGARLQELRRFLQQSAPQQ